MQGLGAWEGSSTPFTQSTAAPLQGQTAQGGLLPRAPQLPVALQAALGTSRGLLVVGQASPEEAAAGLRLAALLGWPCVADVLSGVLWCADISTRS